MTTQPAGSVSRACFAFLSASSRSTIDRNLRADRAATLRKKKKRFVPLAGTVAGARAGQRFFAFAGVCALLLGCAVAGQAQTTPTSIVVSPANPLIGTTQTQQFTTPSGDTIELQGAAQVASESTALHTCALLSNGTVECWGYNSNGQLGNGTTTNSSTAVAVSGLSGAATAIAAGQDHTCALLSNGTVECWGYNSNGQLGNGTTTNSSTPVAVSGLSGATAIAAGELHTCVLLSGGTVECWGYNSNGQLGNGTTTDSSTPVTVSGLSGTATAIAAGELHTCVLLSGGTVECWGYNSNGQLGNGTTTDSSTPVTVSGLSGAATAIAAGELHTCALLSGGT